MNLKEALRQKKLSKFIAERKDKKGDASAFDATLSAMARKSSKDHPSSKQDGGDD